MHREELKKKKKGRLITDPELELFVFAFISVLNKLNKFEVWYFQFYLVNVCQC